MEKQIKQISLDVIEKLFEYLDYIYRIANANNSYGYVCYFKDYVDLAKKIPKDKIVVDVGCSFGLQHLLFQKHKGYIGIQKFRNGNNANHNFLPNFEVFTDNAKIIEGNFKDVWQRIGITEENKDEFYGIANHSLWHDQLLNKEDIGIFKGLFPKNYYVTSEDNKIIQY